MSVAGQGKIGSVKTSLLAGYTYIKPKYTDYDSTFTDRVTTADYNVLKYRSRHSVKFDLQGEYKIFTLGFSTIYNSRIEAIDPLLSILSRIGEYQDNYQQNGYTRVDLRLAVQATKQLKVSLLGENILNSEYSVRPGLLDGPRSVALRLDLVL